MRVAVVSRRVPMAGKGAGPREPNEGGPRRWPPQAAHEQATTSAPCVRKSPRAHGGVVAQLTLSDGPGVRAACRPCQGARPVRGGLTGTGTNRGTAWGRVDPRCAAQPEAPTAVTRPSKSPAMRIRGRAPASRRDPRIVRTGRARRPLETAEDAAIGCESEQATDSEPDAAGTAPGRRRPRDGHPE